MDKRKILVVDDVLDYTRLVKLSLEATGEYEVRVESDPLVVVETAREFKPDVILLDVIMPGMEGGDLAKQLNDDSELGSIPIVFLTASVEPDLVDGRPMLHGMHCLMKPAAVDDITEIIDEVLGTE